MKSSYLINIALLAFIAVLYWFNQQDNISPNSNSPLTAIDYRGIENIKLIRPSLNTISLYKISDVWQLKQPLIAQANATRIKLLLSLLNTPSYGQLKHADDSTLKQLGFNEASLSLVFDNHQFQFGDVESLSKRRYVLHNGIIHLIDDNVTPLLRANATSFIDNQLIANAHNINKISLPLLSGDYSLTESNITIENTGGHWSSRHSQHNHSQLSDTVKAWLNAQALQVVPMNNKLNMQATHTITISYDYDVKAAEFSLQFDEKTLSITDPSRQLIYQFPIELMQHLFPKQTTEP